MTVLAQSSGLAPSPRPGALIDVPGDLVPSLGPVETFHPVLVHKRNPAGVDHLAIQGRGLQLHPIRFGFSGARGKSQMVTIR